MSADSQEVLACVHRSVRVNNGTVSVSFEKEAMRELGILDENDELAEDVLAKIITYQDGVNEVQFQLPE